MANPETRGLISNFIYNHVKDDSLLRLLERQLFQEAFVKQLMTLIIVFR